jgi:DNA invertase Pin-like site-specific DNA recombinase
MVRIGYVRLHDEASAEDSAKLKAIGCHVVRAEEPAGPSDPDASVLTAILDFIGEGDQLVVTRLEHLAPSTRSVLEVIDRLEERGASLYVVEPEITTKGECGRALRAVLQAVAAVEPPAPMARRRIAPPAHEILALQQAGHGPVEIARRLGVSRMTVWRKLKAYEA